ncbi:MAG: hypothetical protein U9R19_07620 [Bacteroidota bacterium]|nr:hypothetical protein [Bacteroidota bacterium]
MKHQISYSLSVNKNTDSTELKCVIDKKRITIFEFMYELLHYENFQNLKENSSANDFYKAIEKFLNCGLNNDTLKNLYQIRTDNFWQYNN